MNAICVHLLVTERGILPYTLQPIARRSLSNVMTVLPLLRPVGTYEHTKRFILEPNLLNVTAARELF